MNNRKLTTEDTEGIWDTSSAAGYARGGGEQGVVGGHVA
jgi:hypothetical protein